MSATATRSITCPQCSASYRLPASFTASKARCKKCGATINLGGEERRPSRGASRRPTTGRSRRPSASQATQAVRGRRSTIAMGTGAKQPVSGLHVLAGVATLGVLVAFLVFAL